MRDVTITCDKCKNVILGDMSVIDTHGQVGAMLPSSVDLCGPCGQALADWLRTKPEDAKGSDK